MEFWGKRLKEIREKHEFSQKEVGDVLEKDITQVSRYERGSGAKKMPKYFNLDLRTIFTDKEIIYIKTGKNNIKIDENFGVYKVEEGEDIYYDIPKDVAMIMEVVRELNKEQRRDVLRYVLEINATS